MQSKQIERMKRVKEELLNPMDEQTAIVVTPLEPQTTILRKGFSQTFNLMDKGLKASSSTEEAFDHLITFTKAQLLEFANVLNLQVKTSYKKAEITNRIISGYCSYRYEAFDCK